MLLVLLDAELHQQGFKGLEQPQTGADGGACCAGFLLQRRDAGERTGAVPGADNDGAQHDKGRIGQLLFQHGTIQDGIALLQQGQIDGVGVLAVHGASQLAAMVLGVLDSKISRLGQLPDGLDSGGHAAACQGGNGLIAFAATAQGVAVSKEDHAHSPGGKAEGGVKDEGVGYLEIASTLSHRGNLLLKMSSGSALVLPGIL